MLRSMRGNSKGLVVSGLMPKAATIGEVRLGPVLRVRFHVVPRQYQTDRYRPHSSAIQKSAEMLALIVRGVPWSSAAEKASKALAQYLSFATLSTETRRVIGVSPVAKT